MSSTADRPRSEPTTPQAWRAVALDQLASANVALIALAAARWDSDANGFVIRRGGVLDDFIRIPAEFTRDIGLGRLEAAIRDRADFWKRQLEGGYGFKKHGVPGLKVTFS